MEGAFVWSFLSVQCLVICLILGGCSSDAAKHRPPKPGADSGSEVRDAGAQDAQQILTPPDAQDSPDGRDSGSDTSQPSDGKSDTEPPTDADRGAIPDACDTVEPDAVYAPDTTAPPPERPEFLSRHDTSALWLWADAETAHAFVSNRWNMAANLIDFATAPHGSSAHAINRFYFEARTYSRDNIFDAMRPITYDPLLTPGEQAHLRAFNARAHAAGIAEEYLDGQAIWLAEDANAE